MIVPVKMQGEYLRPIDGEPAGDRSLAGIRQIDSGGSQVWTITGMIDRRNSSARASSFKQ